MESDIQTANPESRRGEPSPELCRLLDRLPAAAYTCDADGLLTYFNQRAAELWGRKPRLRDPRDRFCGAWRLLSRDGIAMAHEHCWTALAVKEGREYVGREILIERPDGSRRIAVADAGPMYDDHARVIGGVNILWAAADRPGASATSRAVDLPIDDFLSTLSHELRNPLTPLFAGIAIIRRASRDPETVLEHCALMERQLQQLTRLVDEFLDGSRELPRTLQLDKCRVELKALARTAVEENRALIAGADRTVAVTLPPEPIVLDADPLRLGQVFSGLLCDAAAHMPHGGHIELAAAREGSGVSVSVRASTLDVPGDELGVAPHARVILEMHGGHLQIHSAGQGAAADLRMWLPVAPDVAPPASWAPVPGTPKGRRVLLVDDNKDVVRSLSRLVRILGHDVRMAFDGHEALRVASEFRPDVVLMDIGLPGLTGYDAARQMRETHGDDMTLIALTGWGSDVDRRRSLDAGFDEHLTKPVEADVLEALLAG